MTSAIKSESRNSVVEDYGMFILAIMAHGTIDGSIYGTDMKAVKVSNLFNLLSLRNAPLMKEMPKLVLVQACTDGK